MKTRWTLPRNQEIEIEYDESVYSPAHSSIDAVVLGDVAISAVLLGKGDVKVLDLACGSGAMALSLKKLHPEVDISACDISTQAISMTLKNMLKLNLFLKVFDSDLLEGVGTYDVIVTNLPTFTREDMNRERLFGPDETYFADEKDGLKLYKKLFKQVKDHLNPDGYLIVECQAKLQKEFEILVKKHGFEVIAKTDFAYALQQA